MKVSVQQAGKNFNELIAVVQTGEEVVIARRDKVVARLVKENGDVRLMTPKPSSGFGCGKGLMAPEVIDHLTDNAALETEIEREFAKSVSAE